MLESIQSQGSAAEIYREMQNAFKANTLDKNNTQLTELANKLKNAGTSAKQTAEAFNFVQEAIEREAQTANKARAVAEMSSEAFNKQVKSFKDITQEQASLTAQIDSDLEYASSIGDKTLARNADTFINGINKAANAVMGLSMAFTSLKSIVET